MKYIYISDFGLGFLSDPVPFITAVPGSDVHLECSINIPSNNIIWHHNYEPLPAQHSFVFSNKKYNSKNKSVISKYSHQNNISDSINQNNLFYTVRTLSNGTSFLEIKIGLEWSTYHIQNGTYQVRINLDN